MMEDVAHQSLYNLQIKATVWKDRVLLPSRVREEKVRMSEQLSRPHLLLLRYTADNHHLISVHADEESKIVLLHFQEKIGFS